MLSEASAGRREVVADGTRLSYLHAGSRTPVLLLHGTFWSRVWELILSAVAATGHEVLALDSRASASPRLARRLAGRGRQQQNQGQPDPSGPRYRVYLARVRHRARGWTVTDWQPKP